MTGISIELLVEKLHEAIEAKDKERTLLLVVQLNEMVRTDPLSVKWLTEPANIKHLHDQLTEHLGVPSKMMMVKERIPHRQRRANLFAKAIENGVRKIL